MYIYILEAICAGVGFGSGTETMLMSQAENETIYRTQGLHVNSYSVMASHMHTTHKMRLARLQNGPLFQ